MPNGWCQRHAQLGFEHWAVDPKWLNFVIYCLYLIVKCVFQQLGQYARVDTTKKTKLNISSSISTRTESNISLIDDTVQLGRSKRTTLNNSSRGEFCL